MAMRITGDRDVVAALNALAHEGLSIVTVDTAAKTAMKPMVDDAKQRARRNRNFIGKWPGFPQPAKNRRHLDQGLVFRKVKSSPARRSYRFGATGRARRIAHLVEWGSVPHFQPNFRGGWQHPGAQRSPFMVPAFEAHKSQVVGQMGKEMWQIIQRKVTELERRNPVRRTKP